ncbi:hypothetical protein PA598K_01446 [Paenibacillus sp. 598K]|uniref:hypothetical protein n=1 Tax=Paenibacillus sp. 598K TaxID=1117987 RepID=UPI000FFA5359|nr:hypothetical protein [Paenibacillus sp. 598K]GBF73161.1 hypothetical protein PA598K_01446 [Paenibacillus sp. 598K]
MKPRITSEEKYEAALANLVKGAKRIDSPLTNETEKAELLPKYQALAEMIEEYRVRSYLEASPGSRPAYIKMGIVEE